MANDEFVIGQDDTASQIASVLTDDDGTAVNLTGATIAFRMVPIGGGDPKIDDAAANNDDAGAETRGHVSYDWAAGDTDTRGLYLARWKVTFSGGAIQQYPNAGWILVRVTANDNAASHNYITVEQLKKTRTIKSGQTYLDDDIALAVAAASRGIDRLTGRRFWADATPVARYYTPLSGRLVVVDDIHDIDSVKVGTDGGTFPTTLTLHTDYEPEPLNADADGKPWTTLEATGVTFSCVRRSVEVTGKFGWAAVPEEIQQATGILASMLLQRHREAVFGVILSGSEIGAVARIARDDPQVMFLVRSFIRSVRP